MPEYLTTSEARARGLLRPGVARYDTATRKASRVGWKRATSTMMERTTSGEVTFQLPEGFDDHRKRTPDERLKSLTDRLVAEAERFKTTTGEYYVPLPEFNEIAAEYAKRGIPVLRSDLQRIAADILTKAENEQRLGLVPNVGQGWDVRRG